MVLEQFVARIHPGQEAAFEAAMAHGLRTVMARAEGVQGWSFRRCVETPERYQVQIRWASIEAHMTGYKQSRLAPEFRAMVMPFFAEPPQMQHFEVLAES